MQEVYHHTRPRRPPGGDSRAGPKALMGRTSVPSHFPDTEDRPGGWVQPPPQRRHLQGRPVQPHSPAPGRPQWHPAGPRHHHTPTPSVHCATPPGDQRTHGGHQPDAAGGPDLCRPALHPRCGHSCSDPRGSGDSPSGPALRLRTPRHPSTRAPSPGQIGPLLGQPVPPHSPAPGRPQLRHAGPIRRHIQSPSAHHATPPAGLHNRGGQRPGAAAPGAWLRPSVQGPWWTWPAWEAVGSSSGNCSGESQLGEGCVSLGAPQSWGSAPQTAPARGPHPGMKVNHLCPSS